MISKRSLDKNILRYIAGSILTTSFNLRNDINGELKIALKNESITEEELTEYHRKIMLVASNRREHHKKKAVGYIKNNLRLIDVFYLDLEKTKLLQTNIDVSVLIIKKLQKESEKQELREKMVKR